MSSRAKAQRQANPVIASAGTETAIIPYLARSVAISSLNVIASAGTATGIPPYPEWSVAISSDSSPYTTAH
jgi:hypothetical protein